MANSLTFSHLHKEHYYSEPAGISPGEPAVLAVPGHGGNAGV